MFDSTGVGRRTRATGRTTAIASLGAALIALAALGTVTAAPPNVVVGVAAVDGNAGEWTSADRFADLVVYGDRNTVVGDVYARYDCGAGTLYLYATATVGNPLRADRPREAWVQIDLPSTSTERTVSGTSGNDGTPPDFAWTGLDGADATGFEASMPLAQGSHTMYLHVHQWFDDEDGARSLVILRDTALQVACPVVTPSPVVTATPTGSVEATASVSPSASVAVTASPSGGVEAETGTPSVTLPPTDAADGSRNAPSGLLGVLAALAVVVLAAPLAAMRPAPVRRRD